MSFLTYFVWENLILFALLSISWYVGASIRSEERTIKRKMRISFDNHLIVLNETGIPFLSLWDPRMDFDLDRYGRGGKMLSPRLLQIAKLISQGKRNKEIALKLGITEGTVKVYIQHILARLSLRSRVSIAVWFIEKGSK